MRPTTILFALGAVVTCSIAHAEAPVAIFDGRRSDKPVAPNAAETALLESVVHPEARAAWADDGCSDTFVVLAKVKGSFTKRGARQSAVLYRFCNTGRQNGMSGVAILDQGRVAAHVVWKGGNEDAIVAMRDIDGNGLSEIAITDSGVGQGYVDSGISIVELGPSDVKKLGFFDTYDDDCGSLRPRPAERAAVLYVTPGTTPRFFTKRFTKPCHARVSWRPLSARVPVRPKKSETSYRRLR